MNSTPSGDRISLVTLMLASEFGIVPTSVAPGPSGTATRNYVATTEAGTDWFVKTYPAGTARKEAESAAALSEYARRCRVPVAAARYTVGRQRLVASRGEVTVSVTRYLRDTVTADGRVARGRWEAVGEAIGRLHRGLARHRFGPPGSTHATGRSTPYAAGPGSKASSTGTRRILPVRTSNGGHWRRHANGWPGCRRWNGCWRGLRSGRSRSWSTGTCRARTCSCAGTRSRR